MIRRLAHFYVDNYGGEGDALGTDGQPVAGADGPVQAEELTSLVNDYELWFVVVANPDGYDFTFTPGNRLWRKNLHDNNGDGEIVIGDGVDLNRNFAEKWNYDDEGSSSDPANDTYRGTAPNSEPETQAMDGLLRDVGFEFMVNYHSAAELLLYPFGWQVQTTAADDPIFRALSGTDADPAIAGVEPGAPNPYDPDVSSELYTTNGETTDHAYSRYDTLAWTPEMDVSDPERGGGDSVFMFQDSEADLQDAFEKNIPFALDVAHSAGDPANPVSHLDREAADFEVDRFPTSFGDPQPVEALVKRELGDVTINWRINDGAPQSAPTTEFDDGERYGEDGDVYYARVRGEVTGAKAGRQRPRLVRGRRRALAGVQLRGGLRLGRPGARAGCRGLLRARQHPGLPEHRRAVLHELLHGRAHRAGDRARRVRLRRAGPARARPARRAQPLPGGDLVHGRRLRHA